MAITKPGENQEFAFTSGIQEFTVPQSGLYMLEAWGAQGGNYGGYDVRYGGLGGYSKGYAVLKKGDVLYICVGGCGRDLPNTYGTETTVNGGYNGGGAALKANSYYHKTTGGGATHIGKFNNTLAKHGSTDDLYIVAGGGGGASGGPNGNSNPNGYGKNNGGSGGGLTGGPGGTSVYGNSSKGGGQEPPKNLYDGTTFGQGGSTQDAYAGTGGGGLYGGQAGEQSGSGAGGSGYIGGVPTIKYRGQEYTSETKNGVQSGNGKAAITLVKKSASPVYLGANEIAAIYIGNKEITDVKTEG